jgi:hypothetical protein
VRAAVKTKPKGDVRGKPAPHKPPFPISSFEVLESFVSNGLKLALPMNPGSEFKALN